MDAYLRNLWSKTKGFVFERDRKIVSKRIPKESKVLDLGCGDCIKSKEIARERNLDLTALDIENRSMTELEPKIYDGRNVPFEDGSFDYTISMFVLHHVGNEEELVSEMYRVSRKGAIVLEDSKDWKLAHLWKWIHKLQSLDNNIEFFSERELVHLFESSGFEEVHIESENGAFWMGRKLVNAKC